MTNQVNQYERHMAIQEAYQIHDSDEYFKARPQLECGDRRKVFYAGHIRGYQAATQASEQRIQELERKCEALDIEFDQRDAIRLSTIAELQAHVNQLRDALTHADEFIRNGIEFGYVRMPDESLKGIDSAHDTPEIIRKALLATPDESLQAHDNELIERCAKVCDELPMNDGITCAESIRELKDK